MNFTVYKNNENITQQCKHFDIDIVPLTLGSVEKLYIGYYKPFTSFYMFLKTPSASAENVTLKYFNGATWEPLDFEAPCNNLTRSSFFHFVLPDDAQKTTIDGQELYFIELSTQNDISAEFSGLNVLFSDDQDLIYIKSNILDYAENGNWIKKHELARDLIIKRIQNKGNIIISGGNDTGLSGLKYSDIQPQDFLEVRQLKTASMYLVMHNIYCDELSDETEDKYYRNGMRYGNIFTGYLDNFFLKLDNNDNGRDDEANTQAKKGIELIWE